MVPYVLKKFFTCGRLKLMVPNDTFGGVTSRHRHPAFLRPLFDSLLSGMWPLRLLRCIWYSESHLEWMGMWLGLSCASRYLSSWGWSALMMSTISLLADAPMWHVITYMYPWIDTGLEQVRGYWKHHWATERAPFWILFGATCFIRTLCVCEEAFPRIYNPPLPSPKHVSKLTDLPFQTTNVHNGSHLTQTPTNMSGKIDKNRMASSRPLAKHAAF